MLLLSEQIRVKFSKKFSGPCRQILKAQWPRAVSGSVSLPQFRATL